MQGSPQSLHSTPWQHVRLSRNALRFSEVQRDFNCLFARKVVGTGSIYMNASDADINAEMMRRAKTQKHYWPPSFDAAEVIRDGTDLMKECMCPGQYDRYMQWEEIRVSAGLEKDDFFSDPDHYPKSKGPVGGSMLPVELRHHSMVSHKAQRFLTPYEVLSPAVNRRYRHIESFRG